jgi:golgi phosphoprotein 3
MPPRGILVAGLTMLTIPEEFLLVMTKDDDGGFINIAPEAEFAGFVGAAVMDLALQNRIDSDLERIWVVDATATGEPSIDLILEKMAGPGFDTASSRLLDQLVGYGNQIRELALDRLCARAILKREEGRIFWFLKSRRYPVIDGTEIREAKLRLLEVLLRDEIPSPRDICLLSLVESCDLIPELVPPFDSKRAGQRLAGIAKMDLIGQSVGNYVRIVQESPIFTAYVGFA